MIRKNVIGLGELLTKHTSASRLVAIYPQMEVREDLEYIHPNSVNNVVSEQVTPAGFVIVPLPFEDDVRITLEDNEVNENDFVAIYEVTQRHLVCYSPTTSLYDA